MFLNTLTEKPGFRKIYLLMISQLAITCWKLTIETLEQGAKYVKS